MIKGRQFYHWYFGPVKVIEINDDQVSVFIKYSDGIFTESDRIKKTRNFPYNNFDKWFFREPFLITNSIHFEKNKQHRFYYPEYQISYLESDIVKINERIAKHNAIVYNLDKRIINIQREISSIEDLRSYESMNKKQIIEKLEGHQGRLTALSTYIENVENGSIKSPRELKSGLEKLHKFYKEKEELLDNIKLTEKSIELKVSEINNLSRKITSLLNNIAMIEKEKEDKRKFLILLSNKVDKINKDIEKNRLYI